MAELAVPIALVLVESVSIFLNQNFNSSSNVHDDVERAKTCLRKMQAYIRDSDDQGIDEGPRVLQNRAKEVQEIAYDCEDALEEFMLQVSHNRHQHRFTKKMHDVAHFNTTRKASRDLSIKIEKIENRIKSVAELDSVLQQHHHGVLENQIPPSSSTGLLHTGDLDDQDEIWGFEEPRENLIKQLMEGDNSRLLMISVVGPGGSGKTTIVKNVYGSKRVQGFFDCHAWVDVSRHLKPETLLLNMLTSFETKRKQEEPVHADRCEKRDPNAKLRQILEQKRFVVVLDDVWSKQDLAFIVNALPNGLHGSKMVITTRKLDVASSCEYVHD